MKMNLNKTRYLSSRNLVFGNKGMVATTVPLAAEAGLEILKNGGNAIDAAIATAATLTVVEPTSNGIGGDAFAIIWYEGKLYGLNASGPSSSNININKVKNLGFNHMPKYGFLPVNVPGQPYGWKEMINRFGNLTLRKVLEPAINYAMDGYPVSTTVSENWELAFENYKKELKGSEFKEWFNTFTIDGKAPKPGQVWKSENMANSLKELADSECLSFYEGDIADKIHRFSKEYGGFISKEDLKNYKPEWVEPIKANYRGYDIWELPPNNHGLVVLLALKILNNLPMIDNNLDSYHYMIEAMKLAYVDGLKYITDFRKMGISIEELLSDEYTLSRSKLIEDNAIMPKYGAPNTGGTVYLSTADKDGNMVSYIQSNFMGFGSGLVVPGTGIALHNRGYTFSLNEDEYNRLEPNKKTYHTIIPGFITKDNEPIGPFGVMGAYMQPQGHLQTVVNMIDFNLNPQEALDKYRWQWIKDKKILVEEEFPEDIANYLIDKGHEIKYSTDTASFGRGQIIINHNNIYIGGTEKRADGHIAVW
ncbi:MAG: gamma-glutamyltransferase family protein [Tissierellia bacterium]|nr:gamma-glutamyltransferase family protein [Tissierellia bacterium]